MSDGVFIGGLWKENPIFRLVLGTCPTLAVTTSALNGIGMGAATTFVLLGSNVMVALLRNVIPKKVRIPAYIVVIASFVTVVDLLMNAYTHALWKALGIFIPLIVVNCIILGRAEMFAGRNTVGRSVLDALGMGLGFTWALGLLGSIRELLGAGSIFGLPVLGSHYVPAVVMILPPGAFIVLGLLMGAVNKISARRAGA
jgi:electron transport complex protein RnfE